MSADELTQIERFADVLDSARPGAEMVDANWQFHRVINEAARSRHFLVLIRQAVRLIPSNFLEVIPVHDNS